MTPRTLSKKSKDEDALPPAGGLATPVLKVSSFTSRWLTKEEVVIHALAENSRLILVKKSHRQFSVSHVKAGYSASKTILVRAHPREGPRAQSRAFYNSIRVMANQLRQVQS